MGFEAFLDAVTLQFLIAAFAGGAFGAAVGALPAFAVAGAMVVAGEVAKLAGAPLAGNVTGGVSASSTYGIAFGPVFGPHIAFAGGAAATAYAARKGYLDSGFDYHPAKDITDALGTEPDVLAVGGAFGVLGALIGQLSVAFSMPWDPIAIGVTLSALFHRLLLGYSVVGEVRGSVLDMSPFERRERRVASGTGGGTATGAEARSDGGAVAESRFVVEPWLPHQYRWANVAALGLVVGVLGAYVALVTGSPFLAFGISAASLVFLSCGIEEVPVTHHVTLPASTAALAVVAATDAGAVASDLGIADASTVVAAASTPVDATATLAGGTVALALIAGALFGALGALSAELFQRVFYAHGDTHWDPPAAGIVVATFVIVVLYLAGVLPTTVWVPVP